MPNPACLSLVVALLVSGLARSATAQELPSFGLTPVTLQAGQNGSAQLLVGRPVTEQREVVYQVTVPVQKEIVSNGRRVVVTEEVVEARTRVVSVTVMVPEQRSLSAGSFVVMNTKGQRMGSLQPLIGRSVPAAMIEVGDLAQAAVPPFYQKILSSRTPIVLIQAGSGFSAPAPPAPANYSPVPQPSTPSPNGPLPNGPQPGVLQP